MTNNNKKEHSVSRRKKKKGHNTITPKALQYAVIEMGDYQDARTFETSLKKHIPGTRNISPPNGKGKTFSKKLASLWPDYKKEIEAKGYSHGTDEPDWWYISGHHASYGDGKYYAGSGESGFFNEIYYHAVTVTKWKLAGEVKDGIFMITSRPDNDYSGVPSTILAHQKKPNPLNNKAPNTKCKGAFLIGCNTLSVPSVRSQWNTSLPNAILFGYFFAKAPGNHKQQTSHIRSIFKYSPKPKRRFYLNPKTYLDQNGDDEMISMIGKLSKKTQKRRIAAYFDGDLYLPEYSWKGRYWLHKWAYLDWEGKAYKNNPNANNYIFCPVPGKDNPFVYNDSGEFIVGLKPGRRDGNVEKNFKYSEFRKIIDAGEVKIHTMLALILQSIRTKIKPPASVVLQKILRNGYEIQVSCNSSNFFEVADKWAKSGFFREVKKISSNEYSLAFK